MSLENKMVEILNLTLREVKCYLTLLKEENGLSLEEIEILIGEDVKSTLQALEDKGLVIKGKGDKYLALHPRMALTNAWKIYEDKVLKDLIRKRREVDKLVLILQKNYRKD